VTSAGKGGGDGLHLVKDHALRQKEKTKEVLHLRHHHLPGRRAGLSHTIAEMEGGTSALIVRLRRRKESADAT